MVTAGDAEAINSVDYILKNKFSRLSEEEKVFIKKEGPQKPPIVCSNSKACAGGTTGRSGRQFSTTWYEKYEWLTGCAVRNIL